MSIRVLKFGGTSLCDSEEMKNAASVVKMNDCRRAVCVSAPGARSNNDEKITDILYRLSKDKSFDLFDKIKNRFDKIINDLGLRLDFGGEYGKIEGALSRGDTEYIVSRGEYFSGRIMAELLGFSFVDASDVIKFDERGAVREKTSELIRNSFKGKRGIVVPGFYGSDGSGNVKVFSRGGSDITGAIVANALRADVYENFTDVDGFMFSPPAITGKKNVIERMSYESARFLSHYGSRVLHEDSVIYTRRGIPINIKNTFSPEKEGTVIDHGDDKAHGRVVGVTGSRGFALISGAEVCALQNIKHVLSANGKRAVLRETDAKRLFEGRYENVACAAVACDSRSALLLNRAVSAVLGGGITPLFIGLDSEGFVFGINNGELDKTVRILDAEFDNTKV